MLPLTLYFTMCVCLSTYVNLCAQEIQWFGLSGREADTQRGHNSIEKKVLHITAIYRILKSQQRH